MKYQRFFLLLLLSTFTISACKKDATNDQPKVEDPNVTISLTTTLAKNITTNSAESGVSIQVTGIANIEEVGICWSINRIPTINDFSTTGSEISETYNNSSKTFELNINNLDSNTTYFVRSYAKYKDSVYYGNEQTFKTITASAAQQFWTLGSVINADSLVVIYEEEQNSVIFVDKNGNVGVVVFNSGLQAPFEYTVVGITDTLLALQASVLMNNGGKIWNSYSGGSAKIKSSRVNGKIKVEFQDVKMLSVTDSTIANTSASFFVEQ